MRVLCVEPHNDDCAIGVGGIIAKLVSNGADVEFGYFTDGRHGSDVIPPTRLTKLRRKEAEREREVLGVREAFDLRVEDGTLGFLKPIARKEVIATVRKYISQTDPAVIFLPSKGEGHPDHRAAHDIALEAARRAHSKALIVKYSVWFLPPFYSEAGMEDPTDRVLMVGIDAELRLKMRAIRKHESQTERGRYDERARALSRYLGLALKAFDSIGSVYVEVIGVSGTKGKALRIDAFAELVKPSVDITELVHGRRKRKIPGSGARTSSSRPVR